MGWYLAMDFLLNHLMMENIIEKKGQLRIEWDELTCLSTASIPSMRMKFLWLASIPPMRMKFLWLNHFLKFSLLITVTVAITIQIL